MKSNKKRSIKKIDSIRKDFPILKRKINKKRLVYLDSSATTQKPKVVIDSIINFYKNHNANVHRGVHTLSEESTKMFEKAHYTVANFIGANQNEVAFTSGATLGLNIIARLLEQEINKGDEIVISILEHHSNIVPWQQMAKRKGAILKFIPITKDYLIDINEAKKLITKKTKIVSITHVANTTGTIVPINEIGKIAKKFNAYFVVDAAQSAPHIKIDVKKIDCDFLVFSGHKMCAPTGVGVLYGKEKLLSSFEPVIYGGGMISDVDCKKSIWNELPYKFEAGTPPIAQAIALAQAIEYLESIGMGRIEEHHFNLTKYALKKLNGVKGLEIIGPKNEKNRTPIFSFILKNENSSEIHPHDVCQLLDDFGLALRGGTHCAMPLMKSLKISGTTRASFYIYNTKKEVDLLVKGIEEIKKTFI
jgi:cysteine desulfurase / selenocysteine lyase